MAKITTEFEIVDKGSAKLKKIGNAMDKAMVSTTKASASVLRFASVEKNLLKVANNTSKAIEKLTRDNVLLKDKTKKGTSSYTNAALRIDNFKKAVKSLNKALQENKLTQAEYDSILQKVAYTVANNGKGTRLISAALKNHNSVVKESVKEEVQRGEAVKKVATSITDAIIAENKVKDDRILKMITENALQLQSITERKEYLRLVNRMVQQSYKTEEQAQKQALKEKQIAEKQALREKQVAEKEAHAQEIARKKELIKQNQQIERQIEEQQKEYKEAKDVIYRMFNPALARTVERTKTLSEAFKTVFKNIGFMKTAFVGVIGAGSALVGVIASLGRKIVSFIGQFKLSLSRVYQYARSMVSKIKDMIDDTSSAFTQRRTAEVQIGTVMRRRYSVTDEQLQRIYAKAQELQDKGGYSYTKILGGLNRLSAYTSSYEELYQFAEPYVNLLAQRHGFNAKGEMYSIADAIGRSLQGNYQNLARLTGIVLNDSEKSWFKLATQWERAIFLINKINSIAGDMNEVLGANKTSEVQRLQNELLNVKESIGEITIKLKNFFELVKNEILYKIYDRIKAVLDYVKNNPDEVAKRLKKMLGVAISVAGVLASAFMVANMPLILMLGLMMSIVESWSKLEDGGEEAIGHLVKSMDDALFTVYRSIISFINRLITGVVTNKGVIGKTFRGLFGIEETQVDSPLKYYTNTLRNTDRLSYNVLKNQYPVLNEYDKLMELAEGASKYGKGAYYRNNWYSAEQIMLNFSDWMNELYENASPEQIKALENEHFYRDYYSSQNGDLFYYRDNKNRKVSVNIPQIPIPEQNPRVMEKIYNYGSEKIEGFTESLNGNVDAILGIMGEVNGTTIDIRDSMLDMEDEWRELLTKRAQERFNLQYKTLTPTVNISVNSNGSSNLSPYEIASIVSDEIAKAVEDVSNVTLTNGVSVQSIGVAYA